ncbi:MAG: hypothetical protein AABY15_04600 [Nanoarchaeota archaeon]
MAINDNIGKGLDSDFENFNYLPQKLMLEDLDQGIKTFIDGLNISMINEIGILAKVPLIWLAQELWAERKMNWQEMRNEFGEEITRPFMTIYRSSAVPGTSPLKRTIPNKMKFKFVKVPKFDGTLKGYDLWKIPQPVYVDTNYTLSLFTHYMVDVNTFYEMILAEGYSNGQGYMKINGYNISSKLNGDPTENNNKDINQENVYRIDIPILVQGKIVDPTKFEKVNTITKVLIKISEKRR